MKIAYLNTVPTGSTGSIISLLRHEMEVRGHDTTLFYGRGRAPATGSDMRVGSVAGTLIHGLRTRFNDAHGLSSRKATRRLIRALDKENPEVVHLHNIHGYWLHYPQLFQYLADLQRTNGLKIVWTLHDSWALTGGCALPDAVSCQKWMTGCNTEDCPGHTLYPRSYSRHTHRNFQLKERCFTMPEQMSIVTPSEFMSRRAGDSFLGIYPRRVIPTTIDSEFWNTTQCAEITRSSNTVLAVAWPWYPEKGFADFPALRELLPDNIELRVVGLTSRQRKQLPSSITALPRLSPPALREEYARATVLINLSRAETLPTVCLEAQAMGCPVISYNLGGARETIDPESGILIHSTPGPLNAPNPSLPKLAQAVRAMLDSPAVPASAFIQRFRDREAFIDQHLSIYT